SKTSTKRQPVETPPSNIAQHAVRQTDPSSPEPTQHPPCNTLEVCNISDRVSEDDLVNLFSQQPGYRRLCYRTKQNGPMCLIQFEDVVFAAKAVLALCGTTLGTSTGLPICLTFAKIPLSDSTEPLYTAVTWSDCEPRDASSGMLDHLVLPAPAQTSGSRDETDSAGTNFAANSQCKLVVDGDLGILASDWTKDEVATKRRLVRFSRSQIANEISVSFDVISMDAYRPQDICISCIWREEKEGCYITSVDYLSLLEGIISVKLTAEEKNRIRRWSEGFRPYTVSQADPDREEFFRLIMDFPAPLPRKVEKDIKIFPWSVLSAMLKKVITRYIAVPDVGNSIRGTIVSPTSLLSYTGYLGPGGATVLDGMDFDHLLGHA
ncbi:hypothetical protein LTR95_018237, partial [Oleoguttula sp. CCFEE 5521]